MNHCSPPNSGVLRWHTGRSLSLPAKVAARAAGERSISDHWKASAAAVAIDGRTSTTICDDQSRHLTKSAAHLPAPLRHARRHPWASRVWGAWPSPRNIHLHVHSITQPVAVVLPCYPCASLAARCLLASCFSRSSLRYRRRCTARRRAAVAGFPPPPPRLAAPRRRARDAAVRRILLQDWALSPVLALHPRISSI